MEINNTTKANTVEINNDGASNEGATTNVDVNNDESVTMTKEEYNKAIQSAEDKVRGKLSKQIKELEKQVSELKPVEKSQEEIDLENRIAELKESEKQVAMREQKVAKMEMLSEKGLDKSLIDYLKDDADVDSLSELVDKMVSKKMKNKGYVPSDHTSDLKITPEEFQKMRYSEKVELYNTHPNTYRRLMGRY